MHRPATVICLHRCLPLDENFPAPCSFWTLARSPCIPALFNRQRCRPPPTIVHTSRKQDVFQKLAFSKCFRTYTSLPRARFLKVLEPLTSIWPDILLFYDILRKCYSISLFTRFFVAILCRLYTEKKYRSKRKLFKLSFFPLSNVAGGFGIAEFYQ